MTGLALVFPGQGSQAPGMARELADRTTAARDTIAEADTALGTDLSRLMFEGPAEELQLTHNAQPAILTASVAAWRALSESCEMTPVVAAGHSLGEYSALVCAGVLRFADAVRAVRARGQLMQEAVPVGEGAMAAVIGLAADALDGVVRDIDTPQAPLGVAGYNSPDQITISGAVAAVDRAAVALEEAGARRVIRLEVSAPFHSSLMEPVKARLRQVLEPLDLGAARFPVVSNVEATPNDDAGRVIDLLIRQLTQPVRWVESIAAMQEAGATRFVELGAGRVLCGMIRKIDRGIATLNVEDGKSLDATVAELG